MESENHGINNMKSHLGCPSSAFSAFFLKLLSSISFRERFCSSGLRIGLFFSFRFSRFFSFCYLSSTNQRMMKSRIRVLEQKQVEVNEQSKVE